MAVDYDLVIVGGTLEAREAAVSAALLGARIALVEPEPNFANPLQASLHHQAFLQVARMAQQRCQWDSLEKARQIASDDPPTRLTVDWPEICQWVEIVVANLADLRSPQIIAAQGVDVIWGSGQFVRRPRLAFEVGNRLLTARSYLLATGTQSTAPTIQGRSPGRCFTLDTFAHLAKLPHCPDRLVIIGATPTALELAQTFNHLGTQITVVTSANSLLPTEDFDVARLLQAQLEADGVRILRRTQIGDIQSAEADTRIQVNDETLSADAVFIASPQTPRVAGLNLETVGVEWNQQGILVNRRLQTTRSRIYACGSLVGGDGLGAIGRCEAHIALQNALFLPRQAVAYQRIPYAFFTTPEVGRVGLTEAQAKRQYGETAWVLKEPFQTVDKAQLLNRISGFCKLIGRRNGEILGAHIVGAQASELVQSIALAMNQGATIGTLSQFPAIPTTLSTVLIQSADRWRQHQWRIGGWRRDWAENWFNWRRSRVC